MSSTTTGGGVPLDPAAADDAIALEGVGPREPREQQDIFLAECIRWLRGWEKAHKDKTPKKGVAIFVWHEQQRPNAILPGGKVLVGFKESFTPNVVGRAFACTLAMERAYGVDLPFDCDDVPKAVDWLRAAGLDEATAVIFLPDQHAAIVLRRIVQDDAVRIILEPEGGEGFALSKLDTVLERFYHHAVSTHLGHCRIWEDVPTRKLRTEPEKLVQGTLFLFLIGLIEMHGLGAVRVEVHNPAGRNDIEIICHVGQEYRVGILELKVLKPTLSAEKNLEWALQGIEQVLGYSEAYRDVNGLSQVDAKFVCCYDGRKQDKAMPELFAEASKKAVEARRYFMATPGCDRTLQTFTA